MAVDASFEVITDNAMDYLRHAQLDMTNRPKQLTIQVYSAIELFLKARLLHHDWKLIIQRNPDRTKFEDGDFVSVPFAEACDRLDKQLGDPLPADIHAAFDELRKVRNRAVHFAIPFVHPEKDGTGGSLRETRKAALTAWDALHRLLTGQWATIFADWQQQLIELAEANRRSLNYGRIFT